MKVWRAMSACSVPALLLASCSGGTPKSTATTTTTTVAHVVGHTSPPGRPSVVNFEPCPVGNPGLGSNAQARGLDKMLIPIDASAVRLCRYSASGDLFGSGFLTGTTAVHFERETNGLPTLALPRGSPNCGVEACGNALIFANGAQRVFVYQAFGPTEHASGNTEASNGSLAALPTTQWLTELQRYASGVQEGFIGQWEVHDAQLRIESNRTGTVTSNCGPPCVETDDLALSLSALPSETRMIATITEITFTDGTTGKVIPNPDPVDAQHIVIRPPSSSSRRTS